MQAQTHTYPTVRFPDDIVRTDGVAGAHGRLLRWTLDDRRTVLRSDSDFERALADAAQSERWGIFDLLCNVQDHLGQPCVAVESYTVANDQSTVCVRFADGWELYAWAGTAEVPGDVVFD